MASRVAELVIQSVFDGALSVHDMEIERRPYHRNCNCALHKQKGGFSIACFRQRNISFPKKQTLTNCSFSISASKLSSQPSHLIDQSNGNRVDSYKVLPQI